MKKLIVVIVLLLTSCKTIDFEARMPDENGNNGYCHITYTGIGKSDIQGLSAKICGGSLGVDKSTWDTPMQAEVVACLIAPKLCVKPNE